MSKKSGLDIVGLPNLFQSISNEMKTGTLKVQNEQSEKYVYFRSGDIQQVSSPQKPSIIAEGLRRHPEVGEEYYTEFCKQQRETGQSLASLLKSQEEGQDIINAICQFQILEEICELFTWKDCHSEFIEGDPDPMYFNLEVLDIEPMNTGIVLLEAARRYDEWQLILEVIPSKKDVLYQTGSGLPEDCEEDMIKVLSAVDGFRDIGEILEHVRLSSFYAMKALANLVKEKFIGLKSGRELIQMAKLDVFRENTQKSLNLYERAVELGESNTEINMWLAHSYEAMGMKDKAAKQYREVGYSCLYTDLYPGAIRAFEMVTQMDPEDLESQERLVTLLAKMHRWEEYSSRVTSYARWLSLRGEKDRAILILQETTEKAPDNCDNLELLASLYQESNNKIDAIKIYQKLAEIKLGNKELEAAIASYNKIILLDRENLAARKSMAVLLQDLGKQEEALMHYRIMGKMLYHSETIEGEDAEYLCFASKKIIEQVPGDLTVRHWLAASYIVQKDNDKAIKELEEIISHVDEKKELALLVESLKSLVKLRPNDLEKRKRLAETYIKMKKEKEGIQEYFTLGTKSIELENKEFALQAFNNLLAFEPANFATRLKKSELLISEGEKEQAMQELILTGFLSKGADKLWQAVKAFKQALSIDKNSHLTCYYELGSLYEKLGKLKEAKMAYKKHVQKNVKQNNYGVALNSCEKILALEPEHDWANRAKSKIEEIKLKV